MDNKKRIDETNFMRRMMGLQPINEGLDVDATDNEQMQLVSNVMTPGGTTVAGISTVPFKNSDEGREWAAGDKKKLSGERLKNATQQTFTDEGIGGWKIKAQNDAITIEDNRGVFFRVDTVTKGNPNWTYVATPSSNYDEDYKDEDFINGIGQSFQTYKEYANWIGVILSKHSPSVEGETVTSPTVDTSWCKRNLDIDWYFNKLMVGKSYLKKGDCGESVEVAQDHMNEYEGSEVIDVDGKYGNDTISQVKVVQGELGLKDDGYYGKKTHDELIRAIGAGKGAPDQPEEKISKIEPKTPQTPNIDNDIESDFGLDIGDDINTDVESDFDFDRDVKDGVNPLGDITDMEIDQLNADFENKAKEKSKRRLKIRNPFKKRSKGKAKYNVNEQKTMRIKKDGKIINLTESDLRRIVKKVIK